MIDKYKEPHLVHPRRARVVARRDVVDARRWVLGGALRVLAMVVVGHLRRGRVVRDEMVLLPAWIVLSYRNRNEPGAIR